MVPAYNISTVKCEYEDNTWKCHAFHSQKKTNFTDGLFWSFKVISQTFFFNHEIKTIKPKRPIHTHLKKTVKKALRVQVSRQPISLHFPDFLVQKMTAV